jgi:tetratricopeptide (TPR) repeat protein
MGKLQDALDSHNKSLKIDQELNDRIVPAKDYVNIGTVLADMGKSQDALVSYNKSLKIRDELKDRVEISELQLSFLLTQISLQIGF